MERVDFEVSSNGMFDKHCPFLSHDTMRKRGLCCHPVSCLSVRLSRWCILSTRLKISSNFFLGPVAPSV